jgi:hypothetical protein
MSYHKGIWDALDCIEDESLQALAEATKGRMRAQGRWERELREARKSHSLRVVATAAGVSHARVAQIVKSDSLELIRDYSGA